MAQQGYPISDIISEQNQPPPAGDGQVHQVQYFERARFEAHPENSSPYGVLLGPLGREQFQGKHSGIPVLTVPPALTINPNATPTPSTETELVPPAYNCLSEIRSQQTRLYACLRIQRSEAGLQNAPERPTSATGIMDVVIWSQKEIA